MFKRGFLRKNTLLLCKCVCEKMRNRNRDGISPALIVFLSLHLNDSACYLDTVRGVVQCISISFLLSSPLLSSPQVILLPSLMSPLLLINSPLLLSLSPPLSPLPSVPTFLFLLVS